jgi:DNA adenine methylase
MENDESFYYAQRKEFNGMIESFNCKRMAEIFYYMNHTGYNGLCRFNKKGEYNVPFGKYKTITYMTDFTGYKEQLSGWVFICGDFESVPIVPGDFIYADPPYDVEFRQYSKDGFSWEDQVRLAKWLSNHDGPVVASNQATERIIGLYYSLGFNIEKLKAPRMISCDGNRTKADEILATRGLTGKSYPDTNISREPTGGTIKLYDLDFGGENVGGNPADAGEGTSNGDTVGV